MLLQTEKEKEIALDLGMITVVISALQKLKQEDCSELKSETLFQETKN